MQTNAIVRIEKNNNGTIEITRGNLGCGYKSDCLEIVVKKILKYLNIDESTINESIGTLISLEELINRGCCIDFVETKESYDLNIKIPTEDGVKELTRFCSSKKFGGAIKVFTEAENWSNCLVSIFVDVKQKTL